MATALSLLVLTATALVLGAAYLWRRGGARRQVVLMLVLAALMAINVALLAVPLAQDPAPIAAHGLR
jgi:hypothetical protein